MSRMTTVYATTDVVGFHSWPDAPAEVQYLASRHRHSFKIRIELEVRGNDRQVEFHMLKRAFHQYLGRGLAPHDEHGEMAFGSMSCEDIASEIMEWLTENYPDRRWYEVHVSEDGENGVVVSEPFSD